MTAGMTNKDWQLIEKANSIHCSNYMQIDSLIKEADTKLAKELLQSIRNRKFHYEEYFNESI